MTDRRKAALVFEDGVVHEGFAFGAKGEAYGEVVFNTAMSGYQEILTDPSYRGQLVLMTYPLIGNYGVNPEDVESRAVHTQGFIVRELSRVASSHRATATLDDYLKEHHVVGIEGVDTR
ncbi:MAG: carbamoyl-phosphate synthase domain-containing protein, partial [Planctomycetota bacterium JB042]